MAGVGPMALAGAVRAVALVLDRADVEVIGLDGRNSYPFDSNASVTVSVHVDSARSVEVLAGLFGLGLPDGSIRGLSSCAGDWLPPVHPASAAIHVSLYGPAVSAGNGVVVVDMAVA